MSFLGVPYFTIGSSPPNAFLNFHMLSYNRLLRNQHYDKIGIFWENQDYPYLYTCMGFHAKLKYLAAFLIYEITFQKASCELTHSYPDTDVIPCYCQQQRKHCIYNNSEGKIEIQPF